MSEILLTHCNHLYFDRKQVRKMQPYPPLQTLLAAACLRSQGFDVALFDSTFDSPCDGFEAALARTRPRLVAIVEDNFNFLTKMCLGRNRDLTFSMCAAARTAGIPVVVNSADASDNPAAYRAAGAQEVIAGEVEWKLVEIAARLLGARATRPLAHDLDALPAPAWDLVEMTSYRDSWMRAHGCFSLIMASSRGCPYHCNWCAKPIWGSNYQVRSARLVADEMRYLKSAFAPDRIWFADDIFAMSQRWTLEFAAAVEELDARIPFKMQSRCDLMTRPTVEALARAGCAEVWMGAESGSQKVLDAMEKGQRVDQIYQARQNLREHGIRACYFLQFGYPGEEWDDIQMTIRMVRETKPDDIGISVAYPLPGTKFYQRVQSQLGAKQNWEDSDDLTVMFEAAYPTEFYKALRDALHVEVSGGDASKLWHVAHTLVCAASTLVSTQGD